ncbi:MAG: diacylglycerol kinase family protein [Alphaproteobacteria bacterium]|nr:diacylglycerol kinase family protein [Alphaproteobacteria bacterium]
MKRFSLADRLESFRYALHGLDVLVRTQHNARIHLTATIIVVVAGLLFGISLLEWAVLAIAISVVWLAEALNTGFEFVCDVVTPSFHLKVKQAKDVAAGGVLIAALGAAVAGVFIFLPHVQKFLV